MATDAKSPPPEESGGEAALGGNYEVIRARLVEQGRELSRRTEQLNEARKETFGGTELAVASTERIRTENNCVPRDIVSVKGHLLLGYNVFIGLKSETKVSDVFALQSFAVDDEGKVTVTAEGLEAAGGFFQHPTFEQDFASLYRYARDARLLKLLRTDTQLFAAFQIGGTHTDRKVFRWRIEADGAINYVDDRGDRELVTPRSHDFEWSLIGVDKIVEGKLAALGSGDDKVFLSTDEGRLALRVEDNTPGGRLVFEESVTDGNQKTSDATIFFAEVGSLVLVKVLPYREQKHRYLVYNTRSETAVRLDPIGQACIELPEDHGIVFPGGYYLQTGDYKLFEAETDDLEFERKIVAPNGEDVLYVFHRHADGHYVLFPYNLIRKSMQTPIHCHGYSLFPDGRMVVFRATSDEPTRVHPMQVWNTPFTSAEYAAAAPTDGSFLSNVGNAELVRGISEAFSICRLITDSEPSRLVFEELVAATTRAEANYYWIGNEEAHDLKSVLTEIRGTADLIIDEFEKVVAFKQQAAKALAETEEKFVAVTRDLRPHQWEKVEPFLEGLTSLRSIRGHIITLREVRYIDLARLDELEAEAIKHFDDVSQGCVKFMLGDDSLAPLKADIEVTLGEVEGAAKVSEVTPLKDKIDGISNGLDVLSEVIANLEIEDATQRTQILEGIGEVFAQLNRARATIEGRRKQLMSAEGKAEFAAQFALLGQSVSSALGMCDTPEKCDEQLSRLMVQLEELEGRFSEFDEFLGDLATKREEIYEAFSAKKQTLLDQRQRRIGNLAGAAERILEGVGRRARSFKEADELNAYFASDAMVMKVRNLAEQLVELGDSVKADGYLAKVKALRQEALRGLRDKQELFEGGDNLIKLGKHRFSVNTQPLELTMVPKGGAMTVHLTGTEFYQAIDDPEFAATETYWSQVLISETDAVYRAEYLAASILFEAETAKGELSIQKLHDAQRRDGGLLEVVRGIAQNRYDEGYDRGLHDADAAAILDKLVALRESAGLLRFAATPRAIAALFWAAFDDDAARDRYTRQARSLAHLRATLGDARPLLDLGEELSEAIAALLEREGIADFTAADITIAGRYLVEELAKNPIHFTTSEAARQVADALLAQIDRAGERAAFDDDLRALEGRWRERLGVVRAWVDAFMVSPPYDSRKHLAVEVAVILCDGGLQRDVSAAITEAKVTGLLGQHPRLEDGTLPIRVDEFNARLSHFVEDRVPGYRKYRELRHEMLDKERRRLRIDEFMPRVMTAFVRNKLINDVYLHLIGDNLAKQMGAAGDSKRTDLMGLLLLISPPGYGKTTLMEYVANRLGLVFMKVNGPSLGHSVHSLDPEEAPNATARQEVEKINLSFEMGSNVMLYLDDIQHTHPEFLQKFISLCDGQRRIEGVWNGRTRTYDMRGKKYCVVMAGNPYTESGDKFTIPDMLANRADTYNLGDILSGSREAFELSYIENALTSNAVLQPLAGRDQSDIYKLIRMAQGENIATTDLKHGYSAVELSEIKAIFQHMFRCQKVLLMVNQQYIESASQDDKFRTEPPFKLQGSYRNMNRLAEKVVSAMNAEEVEALITDHYIGESQTLTTGAENNLLKLSSMRGTLTEEETERWEDIKGEFKRHKRMGGAADDPVARVTGTLNGLSEGLDAIRDTLVAVTESNTEERLAAVGGQLAAIHGALEAAMQQSAAQANQRTEVRKQAMEHAANLAREQTAAAQARQAQLAQLEAQKPTPDQYLGPTFQRIEAALEGLARPKFEVEVDVKPPSSVEDLLQQQVILIERTLVPIVQTATANMKDGQELASRLAEVMQMLLQIDAQLKQGGRPQFGP